MQNFELLKRTYPTSTFDRYCDGYDFILKNTTTEEREKWGVIDSELQRVIKKDEKYIYQVAKENKAFKVMHLSFKNYEIIRKYLFGLDDK
jgi:hypothetical protein